MDYNSFLERKRHVSQDFGINPTFIPDGMFDFQKFIAEKQIRKGRSASFLDTGTGKTLIELVIAVNYIQATNKPVLILTPLAVAFQFIKEAEKFGIDDIEYSRDGKYTKKIVICNYERLHLFDPSDFECVICDESSILKNFEGAIKQKVTWFLKKIKYRFLFTATPSPNDFVELGTSSEALGYMGYTDMLTTFFTNNEDTISPQHIGTEWILKGHAKDNFFKWVSSWSISMRKPSDLGFSNALHVLPELITNYHSVENPENMIVDGNMYLFNKVAQGFKEIRGENKATIQARCEKAAELASNYDTSVYWCNLNPEGDLLQNIDKNAYQLKGGMSLEKKEEILIAFAEGEIKKLVSKAKLTAFGLNWQHCGHTIFFPTFSYEQYYQAIRRFWRFGRKETVTCDMVFSKGQQRVLDSLLIKTQKANDLFSKLNSTLNAGFDVKKSEFNKQIKLPSFI